MRFDVMVALWLAVVVTTASLSGVMASDCPFLNAASSAGGDSVIQGGHPPVEVTKAYAAALAKLDWDAVTTDLKTIMRESQDWWPADYGHYGGLFIRMAWHCTGTYRLTDGRGGCDGGLQRFDPERSWDDNTNLDKARKLLEPIKLKYGLGLSWGDLMVLAGTVAIEDMGGPVLGFCAGRVDHVDNSQSLPLGPTTEQEHFAKCETQGDCKAPLGQNTMGLIYVNPEGPLGQPDPKGAADTIRDVFGRMDMGDRENVALIGGGHTFGKAHGACPAGAGPSPAEDPIHPWPGKCGIGKGNETATSGFEGAWTADPVSWDNNYFKYLLDFEWEKHVGPGGHYQWRVKGSKKGPQAPVAFPPNSSQKQDVMMLTTDIALVTDPEYKKFVQEFATNMSALNDAFAKVWYKLVTRDMGPVSRCVGPKVPPAQPFQYPLPEPPAKPMTDFTAVQAELKKLVDKSDANQALLLSLAWKCASTFRATDYLGGCNGARIRFPPGKDWKSNEGVVGPALQLLQPIKDKYSKNGLTWADLIVLAGNVAAIRAGAPATLSFCPGRSDATDGSGWDALSFIHSENPANITAVIDRFELQGLSPKEFVALSIVSSPSSKLGTALLTSFLAGDNNKNDENDVAATAIRLQPGLRYWAEYYIASGDDVLAEDFAAAWTKVMTADRFDGPVGNVCFPSDVCLGQASAQEVS